MYDLFDIHSIKRYWKMVISGHGKCTCKGPGKSLLAEKFKTNFLWSITLLFTRL